METIRWNWQLHWLLAAAGPKHLLEGHCQFARLRRMQHATSCSCVPPSQVDHSASDSNQKLRPPTDGAWGPPPPAAGRPAKVITEVYSGCSATDKKQKPDRSGRWRLKPPLPACLSTCNCGNAACCIGSILDSIVVRHSRSRTPPASGAWSPPPPAANCNVVLTFAG